MLPFAAAADANAETARTRSTENLATQRFSSDQSFDALRKSRIQSPVSCGPLQ
jgi:hypothetical protein